MELVPILSTIILVGTIATFILAVAAYILYKIRERRAREESSPAVYAQPEPHVLVAPQMAGAIPAPHQPTEVNVYQGVPAPAQSAAKPQSSLFWEYTDEGFVPVNPAEEAAERPRERAERERTQDEGYAWL